MAPRRSGRGRSQQHWSNTPSNAQEEDHQHLSSSYSVKSNFEDKEEIHYLKNKLDQKYDTIEDMEHDLDEYENKSK